MFSTKEQLEKKTGPAGIGRFSYLRSLASEFRDTTTDKDARRQVLANLANFAYDPINYTFIRRLNIIALFLDALNEDDEKIVEFAIGGICNLALDKENKDMILSANGVQQVAKSLFSPNEETVLSAVTTLMFLITPKSRQEITSPEIVEQMKVLAESKNKRLSNLGTIFLQDYVKT